MTLVISPDENAWETNFAKCFVVAWWPSKSSNSEIQKHGESIYLVQEQFWNRTNFLKSQCFTKHWNSICSEKHNSKTSPRRSFSGSSWNPYFSGKILFPEHPTPQPGLVGWDVLFFSSGVSFGSFNPELWSKGDFNLSRNVTCDLVSE